MPFYEYECPHCKFYHEVLQKISDPSLKKCPSCGRSGFKRLISAPVFRLKGAGWYETDFKSDKENKRNLVGGDREDAKPASTESKSDAQADAKADAGSAKDAKTETAAPKVESAQSGEGKSGEAKSGEAKAGKPARSKQRRSTAQAPARRVARKPK
jgi:putative FmdB family regulatory protein